MILLTLQSYGSEGTKVSYSSEDKKDTAAVSVSDEAVSKEEEPEAEAAGQEDETISGDNAKDISFTDKDVLPSTDISFSDNSGKVSSTDIGWKNPGAHRKPSSGVKHSEADYQKHLTVYCLDEGKADAFVLFSGTSNAVVIDNGKKADGDDILNLLEEHGLNHVSALIITHFDKDHVGGADEVINGTDVDQIYVTRGRKDSKQMREFEDAMEQNNKTAKVIDKYFTFEVDGTKYEIFPPAKKSYGDEDNESNNSSLVVKASNADNSMFFAGDVENERISELISSNYDLKSNIIKMPHHGKVEKLTDALLRKVTPQYAVITSSDSDPEDEECLKLLKDYEVETYLTRKGEILIDMLPGEISVDQ